MDFSLCDNGECPGGPETGADKWSCLLSKGYCCDLKLGTVLTTEPGVKQGPFKKAIDDFMLKLLLVCACVDIGFEVGFAEDDKERSTGK